MKYPNITVHLSGENGNIFAIIGSVSKALRRSSVSDKERQLFADEIKRCSSYDEALRVCMQWVNCE